METYDLGDFDVDAMLSKGCKIKNWEPISIGKYEGLTIPELIFLDPQYFYWALTCEHFTHQLRLEANLVASRLQHMKVPPGFSEKSCFVVGFKKGIFDSFVIREKRASDDIVNFNRVFCSHLDFSLVSRPNSGTDYARKIMVEGIKKWFFEKDADLLRSQDYQEFMGDPDHFESGCSKVHIPGIPRWNDKSVIEETLKQGRNQKRLFKSRRTETRSGKFRKMQIEGDEY